MSPGTLILTCLANFAATPYFFLGDFGRVVPLLIAYPNVCGEGYDPNPFDKPAEEVGLD